MVLKKIHYHMSICTSQCYYATVLNSENKITAKTCSQYFSSLIQNINE